MKVPLSWLAEWIDLPADQQELTDRLTFGGLEIDVDGNVQPEESQVAEKATYWENPGQFPRTIMIS